MIRVGDRVKTRSGREGIVKMLDWKDNKVVSAGVEIKDEIYAELVHQLIQNLELI